MIAAVIALLLLAGLAGAAFLGLFGSRPPGPIAVVSPSPSAVASASLSPTSTPFSGTPGPTASAAFPSVAVTAPVFSIAPSVPPPPTPTPTARRTATPTPTPVPEIVRFRREDFVEPERNIVDCTRADFDGTIRLAWQVRNATGVELSIDGPGLFMSYDADSTGDDVPFACEMNASHQYTLTTTGGNGPPDSVTRTIRVMDPRIVSFDVTISGSCADPTPPGVTVSWQIEAATGVSLYIDDAIYANYNDKSAQDVPVSSYDCTKPSQTYRLVTSGGYGPDATETRVASPV